MSVYIPAELRRQVRKIFVDRCAYCQTAEELTAVTFEVEHIIPRVAGGKTSLENLCLACPTCNRYKAHRQSATDPVTNEQVPLFHPNHQQWKDHFTWDNDMTDVIGLTPVGRATIAALRMNRQQLTRLRGMWIKLGKHPPETIE